MARRDSRAATDSSSNSIPNIEVCCVHNGLADRGHFWDSRLVEPTLWNVVVAGAWNRAILTPQGIRDRLFHQVETGRPFEVQVAIDGLGPPRVVVGGLAVVVSPTQLVVDCIEPSVESLSAAQAVASTAVTALRETPVTGVGVNFRYASKSVSGSLLGLLSGEMDDRLTEAAFVIRERETRRTLVHGHGVVNVAVVAGERESTISLNFHRDVSRAEDAVEWLATASQQFHQEASRLVRIFEGADDE